MFLEVGRLIVRCWLYVACGLLCAVCCLWFDMVCACLLFVVSSLMLFVGWGLTCVVCSLLFDICCLLLDVGCLLCLVCGLLSVVCSLCSCCLLFV